MTERATQIAAALAENAAATARALREGASNLKLGQAGAVAVEGLGRDYDAARGGFGGAPKFPPSMVLEFLLRHHERTGERQRSTWLAGTCAAMARGGMYDQLGGGFARYSVNAGWVVPHFEKMLYDNALLARVYAHLWRRTGSALAGRVAAETCDWMLRELRTAEGGLASSLDADSEGEEGKFYVWRPAELRDVLGAEDGEFAAAAFGVTPAGTFEHGASVLQRLTEPDDPERFARVRDALLAARGTRVRPGRDDKVVAAWNGMAISALAECGLLLARPDFTAAARDTAGLLAGLHLAGGRLVRTSRDGTAGDTAGTLEDYACVAEGFLHPVRGYRRDPLAGAGRGAARGHARLLRRRPGRLLRHGRRRRGADLPPGRPGRQRHPVRHLRRGGGAAQLLGAGRVGPAPRGGRGRPRRAVRHRRPLPPGGGGGPVGGRGHPGRAGEIAVVGGLDDDRTRALHQTALRAAPPGAVLALGDGSQPLDSTDGVPLLGGRGLVDGTPAAYVCRQFTCQAPVTTPEQLRAVLAEST